MDVKSRLELPRVDVTGRTNLKTGEAWYRIKFSDGTRSSRCIVSLTDLDSNRAPLINAARRLNYSILGKAQDALITKVGNAINEARTTSLPSFAIADNIGWVKDFQCYVTPQETYGAAASKVEVTELDVPPHADFSRSGSLDTWTETFGEMLAHNRLFVFGACVALMPPLLKLVGYRGCMIVFTGETSTGKSTLQEFMGSLRGGTPHETSGFQETFRTTPNFLERYGLSANDGLLLLDDIRSIPGDARKKAEMVEEALYLYAGAKEKSRLTNKTRARALCPVVVSSDNFTLVKLLDAGRVKADGSMGVRLIQIAIDSSTGVIDRVPTGIKPEEYIEKIGRDALKCYGAPTHKFLKRLLEELDRDRAELISTFERRIKRARAKLVMEGSTRSEHRIGKYFGLAYATGCFAIEHNILPISRKWLLESIAFAYEMHLAALAEAMAKDPVGELRKILEERSSEFLDLRGGRRCSDNELDAAAGFRTGTDKVGEFSFTKEQFRALLPPHIPSKRMCDSLKRRGLLIHDTGTKKTPPRNSVRIWISKTRRPRVYCILDRILDGKA